MNNMFKKTLVAAALAGMSTTAMANVGVDGGPVYVSSEYVQTVVNSRTARNTVKFDLTNINFTFQEELTAGDQVTVTFSKLPAGVTELNRDWFGSIIFNEGPDSTRKAFTLGVAGASGNTVTYRVTNIDDTSSDKTTIGATVNLTVRPSATAVPHAIQNGMRFHVADAAEANVTITPYQGAVSANNPFRTPAARSLFTVHSQFANLTNAQGTSWVNGLFLNFGGENKDIEVTENDRQTFVGAEAPGQHTFSITTTPIGRAAYANHAGDNDGVGGVNAVEGSAYYAQTRAVTYHVTGNTSWLNNWVAARGIGLDAAAEFLTIECNNAAEFSGRPGHATLTALSENGFSFRCFGMGNPEFTIDLDAAMQVQTWGTNSSYLPLTHIPRSVFSATAEINTNLHNGFAWNAAGRGTANSGVNQSRSVTGTAGFYMTGFNTNIPYLPASNPRVYITMDADTNRGNDAAREGTGTSRDLFANTVNRAISNVGPRAQDNVGYGMILVSINGNTPVALNQVARRGVTDISEAVAELMNGQDATVEIFVSGAHYDVKVHSAYVSADGVEVPVHNDSQVVSRTKRSSYEPIR